MDQIPPADTNINIKKRKVAQRREKNPILCHLFKPNQLYREQRLLLVALEEVRLSFLFVHHSAQVPQALALLNSVVLWGTKGIIL